MAQINTDLETLKIARDNMKLALEGQGQTVTKDIRTYAQAISNISGGGEVKLFDTIAHMQEDPTAQDGDLAIVYREEIQPINGESEFSVCKFPNRVVLDEAFTSNIRGDFRAVDSSSGYFDGMLSISSSSFRFNGWGDNVSVNIQYTSEDGITYTRTDGGDEVVDFGVTVVWSPYEEFDPVISKFMYTNGTMFEGLYQYKTNVLDTSKKYISYLDTMVTDWAVGQTAPTSVTLTPSSDILDIEVFKNICKKVYDDVEDVQALSDFEIWQEDDNNWYFAMYETSNMKQLYRQWNLIYNRDTREFLGLEAYGSGLNYPCKIYRIDLLNNTYVLDRTENWITLGTNYSYIPFSINSLKTAPMPLSVNSGEVFSPTYIRYATSSQDSAIYYSYSDTDDYYYNAYFYVGAQLSLNNSNQLLPNKTALGKGGLITGDSSIYSNLDASEMYENYYKLLYNSNEETYYGIKQNYYRFGSNNHISEKSNIKYYAPSNKIYDIRNKGGIMCIPSNMLSLCSNSRLCSPNRQYYYVRDRINNKIKSYDSSDVEVSCANDVIAVVVDSVEGLYFMDKNQNTSTESTNIYKIDLDTNTKSTVATIPAIPSGYVNSYQNSYEYERVDNYVFFRKCGTSNGKFLNRVYMLDLQDDSLTKVVDVEETANTTSAAIMLDSKNNKIFLILIYTLSTTYGQAGDYTEVYELQTASANKSFSLVTTINKSIANLISDGLKYCTAYEYDSGKYVYSGDNLSGIMDLNNSTQEYVNGVRWYKNNVYKPYSNQYSKNSLGSNLIYSGNKLYYAQNEELYISNVSIEVIDNKKYVRFDGQDITTYNPILKIYDFYNYPVNPDNSFTTNRFGSVDLSKPRIIPATEYGQYNSYTSGGYLVNDTTLQVNESCVVPSSGNTLDISGRVYSKIDKPSDSENVIIGMDTSISNGNSVPRIILIREPRN